MPRSADNQTLLHTFGRRVRARRLELGLSQMALAEAAGMSRNHIGCVERAELAIGLETLVRLADGLQIDVGALVAGLEVPRRRP
ncbi:MAG TPA: helix-turn-helix transcriptional regulator [Acidimicrobiales bacterium]|nr:helix-turn-helix transcriptional regulator [Acidimicrobiales bacterium]